MANISFDTYQNATYTLYIRYHGNGGSEPTNQSASQTTNAASVSVGINLRTAVPTRAGYDFLGYAYSQNGSVSAQPGQYVSNYFTRTVTGSTQVHYSEGGNNYTETIYYTQNKSSYLDLYAQWRRSVAKLSTVSDTPIGLTGTATWTKIDNAHTYKLVLSLSGADDVEIDNIAAGSESCSFTIPSTWLAELPNSTSATATAVLYTYNNGELLGSTSKTFTVSVPASVKPTISAFTATPHSANATVDGWGVPVQGLSYLTLAVTAAAGTSASVVNVSFTGPGIAQSSTAASGDTATVTSTGTLEYTVTVTDSRGRTATQTINVTSYEYANPIVHSLAAVRCMSNGTASDTDGNYLKALPVFVYSSVNGHNSLSVKTIEYKEHGSQTWLVGAAAAVSGSWSAVFGPADITKAFDVKITITDALGNTYALEVTVQSVVGFGLGLKNDRARFGGPCEEPGLVCDWKAKFKDDVTLLGDLIGGGIVKSVNGFSPTAGAVVITKSLWSGTWSSGDITIDGINDYTLFKVRVARKSDHEERGVALLCTIAIDSSDNQYFGGECGIPVSATAINAFYFRATKNGNTLTFLFCYQETYGSSSFTAHEVIEIIGVI